MPRVRVEVELDGLRSELRDPFGMRALYTALFWSAVTGMLMAIVVQSKHGFIAGVAAGLAASGLCFWFLRGVGPAIWRGLSLFITPGMAPPDDFSLEKSLLARGQVDDALAALEVLLADGRENPRLLLFTADAYAREAGRPREAEALFIRARNAPTAKAEDDFRATVRLLDLYEGPLADPERAMQEMVRLRDRHPGTTAGLHAAHTLAGLGIPSRPAELQPRR